MKLNEVNGQFEALGIGVAGMTYDDTDLIQQFHDQWGLEFPLLRDVDRQHVEAWEILNEEYGEGGQGSGRMPGFGDMLTSDMIDAIVEYERNGLEQNDPSESDGGESAAVVVGAEDTEEE